MDFTVGSSPSKEVVLSRFDAALFPKFLIIFEGPSSGRSLEFLARPSDEAERAVVMENRADKDITALRYYWVMTGEDGKVRKHTVSADSYMVDVYHPVLKGGDRKLICRGGDVDETLLDHLLGGGGIMGAAFSGGPEWMRGVVSVRLEIDILLFADGEIAGLDTGKFAAELQSRKPAAEFVAKQIRLAQADNRDVTPVLSALVKIPCIVRLGKRQDDPLVHWIRHYARQYLRAMRQNTENFDMREATLRHFENRPTLPRFYRRDDGTQ